MASITKDGPAEQVHQTDMDVWCIWTKTGHRPRRFHSTREIAETEAERLAKLNPGKAYIVMQMVGKFKAGEAA